MLREVLYLREEQSWLFVLLGFEAVILAALLIGFRAPWQVVLFSVGLLVLVAGLISQFRLDLVLESTGISLRYFPLQMKYRCYKTGDFGSIRTFRMRQDKISSFGYSRKKKRHWYTIHQRQAIKLSLHNDGEVSFSIASRESWVFHLQKLKEQEPGWKDIKLDFTG